MATYEYDLLNPPEDNRARELWMQHAAGFIIFQDVREYAIDQIDKNTDDKTKAKIIEGIDNAVYGLMMIWDGVSGSLNNENYSIRFETKIKLESENSDKKTLTNEIDVIDGDGMCMGFHGWKENDIGEDRIVKLKNDKSLK